MAILHAAMQKQNQKSQELQQIPNFPLIGEGPHATTLLKEYGQTKQGRKRTPTGKSQVSYRLQFSFRDPVCGRADIPPGGTHNRTFPPDGTETAV